MDEIKRDHKIYKYTNIVNGKISIGRTCQTLEKRAGSRGQNYKSCFKNISINMTMLSKLLDRMDAVGDTNKG